MRQNIIATVTFGVHEFRMEMLQYSWGPEDPILYQALNGAFDENVSLAWWLYFADSAPASGVLIDVGAFSGIYALIAAECRHDLRVVAFEPSTITWGRLVRNLNLNGMDSRILAANLAAWNTEEWITFRHPYGIYTMCPGESALAETKMNHSASARATRLDVMVGDRSALPDYLNSDSYDFLPAKNIAAIKIDVEGGELQVLEGANRLIEISRPCFICEALSEEAKIGLVGFFAQRHYKDIDIPTERNVIFVPSEKFDLYVDGFNNWLQGQDKPMQLSAQAELSFRVL